MHLVIEISRPIQWRPGFFRCAGVTTFRVWWLCFAVSLYPMRLDEHLERYKRGEQYWPEASKTYVREHPETLPDWRSDDPFTWWDNEPCGYCDGQGWGIVGVDWDCVDAINGPYDGEMEECPNCHGSGLARDMTFW